MPRPGHFYKLQQIPSIKIDQNFGSKLKISGFWANESTTKSNGVDGLPAVLSQVRIQAIRSQLDAAECRLHDLTYAAPALWRGLPAAPESRYRAAHQLRFRQHYSRNRRLPRHWVPPHSARIGDNVYGGMAPGFGPGSRNLFIGQTALDASNPELGTSEPHL